MRGVIGQARWKGLQESRWELMMTWAWGMAVDGDEWSLSVGTTGSLAGWTWR